MDQNFDQAEISRLFNKKFSFQRDKEWCMPTPHKLNTEKIWDNCNLQSLKADLNSVKSLLNDKGEFWHKHTKEINKAGLVLDAIKKLAKPEFLTQAWCKFYEILQSYSIINDCENNFRSFHLCEAPGAFISALNYYLCFNHYNIMWDWYANTLNPYYEGHSIKNVVVDDRLLFHTLNYWIFGSDNTGDILSSSYYKDIKLALAEKGPIHLVTADGSFSCLNDPGEQELIVTNLQLSEVLIALNVLAEHGNFIIKKFTLFECISVCTMYILNCAFEEVHMFKPVTSKSGNSEVYVICLNYKGFDFIGPFLPALEKQLTSKDMALISQCDIPSSFMIQMEQCCQQFTSYQASTIKENLSLYENMGKSTRIDLDELKEKVVNTYIQIYSVQATEPEIYERLYARQKRHILTAYGDMHSNVREVFIKAVGSTFEEMQKQTGMSWSEHLLDVQLRLNSCFSQNKRKRKPHANSWIPVWKDVCKCMKQSCDFKSWLMTGKAFSTIQNSKFCNPLLLLLWNEVVGNEEKVLPENHLSSCYSDWDWDSAERIMDYLRGSDIIFDVEFPCSPTSDLALYIKKALNVEIMVHECKLVNIDALKGSELGKIFVIDATMKSPSSFNAELLMKQTFVKVLASTVKNLFKGDCIALCIPVALTRFTVGMLFMLVSLFSKITTIPASDSSPALTGQLWILSDFKSPEWTESFLEYADYIINFKLPETKAILEVVPTSSVCGGQFYEYLLEANFHCILQALRSLIATERRLYEKS